MIKAFFLVIIFIFLILGIRFFLKPAKLTLEKIDNYICYYGKDQLEELAKFKLVILQAGNYDTGDISLLCAKGIVVLGYLSVGEDEELEVGDKKGPAGSSSWYLDYFIGQGLDRPGQDNQPDQNKDWKSFYVDISNALWQKKLFTKIDALINEKKCSGIFLDTVLFPSQYPKQIQVKFQKGLIKFVKKVRKKYPRIYLVLNNGWPYLDQLKTYTQGIMLEDFTAVFQPPSPEKLKETESLAKTINKKRNYPKNKDFLVLTLDYVDLQNQSLKDFCIKRAKDFGFVPYISPNLELD